MLSLTVSEAIRLYPFEVKLCLAMLCHVPGEPGQPAFRLLCIVVFCKGKVNQVLLEKYASRPINKNCFQLKTVPLVTRKVDHLLSW
jgi:hypothetical protein